MQLPLVNDIYVIADPKLARLILEGDDSKCLRSADKTSDYAKFEYLTVGEVEFQFDRKTALSISHAVVSFTGIKTVFTKKTYAQVPCGIRPGKPSDLK